MARAWNYKSGSIAVGALPDPDPNTTPPDAARIFDAPQLTERNGQATTVQWALDMDVAGTATVTVWIHEKRTDTWFKTAPIAAVADKEIYEVDGAPGAEIFFQLTAPAGFATVEIFAESVP